MYKTTTTITTRKEKFFLTTTLQRYSLEKKARTLGEVRGLSEVTPNLEAVENLVLNQFLESSSSSHVIALHRCVALLVSFPSINPQNLLDALCWLPATLIDSQEIVQNAIFCWSWLIAARPDLELSMLGKLHDAWCHTVDAQKVVLECCLLFAQLNKCVV